MMMKKLSRRLVVIFFSLSTTASMAYGAALTPHEVALRLQQRYEKTSSMSAEFTQATFMKMSRRQRKAAGTVAIKKPNHMRWDYLTPDQQVLLSDGETISMYFAKAQQMIVAPAQDYLQNDVTYSFFAGTGDIVRDFTVLPAEDQTAPEDSHLIKLVPLQSHPQLDYLYVWADKKTFLINRMQIVDQFGSITDLVFSKIKTNQPTPAGYFSFTPPPDTEIIKQ